jgi:hypothetical protein
MPTDAVFGQAINVEELRQAFAVAPSETARFVKAPLFRFARRVAKRVKVESLSGRPGIVGGPWRRLKDKNVQGFTTGSELSNLKAVNKVSRILRTHVEGATITAKGAGFLFLRSHKTGKGTGTVSARVRSVTIPARVKVVEPWQQEIPKATEQIGAAVHRAMSVALDRRMKTIGAAVQRLTSL